MREWILTPEVANFVDNARRFCEFCEESHTFELGERLLRGAILLANLYSAGLFLPEEAPPEEPLRPQIEELNDFPASLNSRSSGKCRMLTSGARQWSARSPS
jgi:hypothetical protein